MHPLFFLTLGMPRGGTSSVAMVIEKLGAPSRLAPNPRIDGLAGYPVYEDPILQAMMDVGGATPPKLLDTLARYIKLRRSQQMGPLSAKQPWLCWIGNCPRKTGSLFQRQNIKWIYVDRPLDDVMESARKKYPPKAWRIRSREIPKLWEARELLANYHPPILTVSFKGLLEDPVAEVTRISRALKLNGPIDEVAGLIHRGSPEPNTVRERPSNWRDEA